MKFHLEITPLKKQIWVVCAPLIYLFGTGLVLGYPSCILPALRQPDSPFVLNLTTASWIASSVGFASMLGYFLVGFSMEYFGRKRSQPLIIVPAVLGWFLIAFAKNIPTIIVGRIFTGISVGSCIGLSAVIIAEYTSPEYRGLFLNLKSTLSTLGSVAVHILQHYINWRTIAIIGSVLNLTPIIIILVFPESPTWLAGKQRFDECEKSFIWLRGKSTKSTKELDVLIKKYKNQTDSKEESKSFIKKTIEFLQNFKKKNFYMPVLVIFLGILVMELCGRHFFVSYAIDIIDEITGDKNISFYSIVGIDTLVTICGLISPILVKVTRRRRLLFYSGAVSFVVLAIFCLYLLLQAKSVIPHGSYWIPLSMFIIYFVAVNLGCSPIPYVLLGELLPVSNKGLGTALVGVILSLCLQISLFMFPFLMASLKVYGAFAVTGSIMTVVLIILYFILPETKDKTLLEIDNFFLYGNYEGNDTKNYKKQVSNGDVNLNMDTLKQHIAT